MQSNQLRATFANGRKWFQPHDNATVRSSQPEPTALDNETIERAAKALFDLVFASCGRLDWANCDEKTKRGFRREATAVIMAVWPNLFQ
jgi:hypothetical protein